MFHIQHPKDLQNGFTLPLPTHQDNCSCQVVNTLAFSAPPESPESPTVHDDQRQLVTDTSYGADLKCRYPLSQKKGKSNNFDVPYYTVHDFV